MVSSFLKRLEPQPQSLQSIIPSESSAWLIPLIILILNNSIRNIDSAGYTSKASEFSKAFFSTTREVGQV